MTTLTEKTQVEGEIAEPDKATTVSTVPRMKNVGLLDESRSEKKGGEEDLEAANTKGEVRQNTSSDQEKQFQSDSSKLQKAVETLKNEKLTDPIAIRLSQDDIALFSADQNAVRSKGKARVTDSSQGSNSLNSESSKSLSASYPERDSVELSQSPPSTKAADMYGSSSNHSISPSSGRKKSISGMSSSLDSHTYFSEFSEHETDVNDEYHFNPTTGIHGNTSKVVATQHRRKAWDWNILPKVGSSVLVRSHSFNIISVPIDGEIKQILYTPSFNKKFRIMNIFMSFNMETKPKDSLIHARRRLISFGNYITHYLKSRMYAFQCYPFFIQGLSEEDRKSKTYTSLSSTHDYAEIGAIISLWHHQAQKFIVQTNSAMFSSDIVQALLQRKFQTRHQSALQSAVFAKDKHSGIVPPKQVVTDSFDEIDVLLIRPLADGQLGWQLAYDEPNLNIADYPLDISPWMMTEESSNNIIGLSPEENKSTQLKIVRSEKELDQLNSSNAGEILLDCMDRKLGRLTDDFSASASQVMSNPSEELHYKHTEGADSQKKKAGHTKGVKRSGLANLFKRKHASSVSQPSEDPVETPVVDAKPSKRTQSIQNSWLEDYFSRYLGNYKRVNLPTQYFLPADVTAVKSGQFTEQEKSEARKAFLFSKESLQVRLPFGNNTIPAIYTPWLWSALSYNKWKPLLREMYRCITPGGYALGTAYDLRISNTFTSSTDESMQEFPSTLEREKTFDAITLNAMNGGAHIYPTRHLVQAFKDVGFSNIKFSLLSLKTGDLLTDMGCLNELFCQVIWDILLRREVPDPSKPPKDTNPPTLFQRYIREHMGKVDENAGCGRILLITAQKPKKSAPSL